MGVIDQHNIPVVLSSIIGRYEVCSDGCGVFSV